MKVSEKRTNEIVLYSSDLSLQSILEEKISPSTFEVIYIEIGIFEALRYLYEELNYQNEINLLLIGDWRKLLEEGKIYISDFIVNKSSLDSPVYSTFPCLSTREKMDLLSDLLYPIGDLHTHPRDFNQFSDPDVDSFRKAFRDCCTFLPFPVPSKEKGRILPVHEEFPFNYVTLRFTHYYIKLFPAIYAFEIPWNFLVEDLKPISYFVKIDEELRKKFGLKLPLKLEIQLENTPPDKIESMKKKIEGKNKRWFT